MLGRRESLRDLIRSQHMETQGLIDEMREEGMRWREESHRREERLDKLVEENREFNREILLRNEKVYTAMIVQIEEGRKQIRANTEAVLRLLDRFDEPGGSTA